MRVVTGEQRRVVAVLLRRGQTLPPDQQEAARVVVDHSARQRWIALAYAVIGVAMWVLFAIGQPRRLSELVFGGIFLLLSAAFAWDTWRLLSAAARQGITRTRRS